MCNADVESGRTALKAANASGALEALKSVKDDAEAHLLRGYRVGYRRQLKDAKKTDEAGQKALETQLKST